MTIADGSSFTVDDVRLGDTSYGPVAFHGASPFSPDGSEIVLASSTALVAVNLMTGQQRPLAPLETQIFSGGAVFLDATRVLWVRVEDRSTSDVGRYVASLRVAGPGEDVVLDAPTAENAFYASVAVSADRFIAWPGNAFMVTDGGAVLVENGSSIDTAHADILGVTPDGLGVITVSYDGTVRHVRMDGTIHELASAGGADGLIGPFAAFAP